MSRAINPEIRAAELFAITVTDLRTGGWFAVMTHGERVGWDKHEHSWWTGDDSPAPTNRREWAGWLAREIHVEAALDLTRGRGWWLPSAVLP